MKNRYIAALIMTCLLFAIPNFAYAAKSGSKSESASAAWVVEGINGNCYGSSPENLTDSKVNNDNAYVWIKSSASIDAEYINWTSYDKGRIIEGGDLDWTGLFCGQFLLMAFDVNNDEDLDYSNYLGGIGSITFKFNYSGKSFTSDSATLY